VQFTLQYRIAGALHDTGYDRSDGNYLGLSKVEVMYELLKQGFVSIESVKAFDHALTPHSPRGLWIGALLKSRVNFEALLQIDSIFAKGLSAMVHDGPHHYYNCLLKLDDLSSLNALEDVSVVGDAKFKELLRRLAPMALLCDGDNDADGDDDGIVLDGPVLALLPLPAARKPPRPHRVLALGAQESWDFPCGDRVVTIRLDGFSHASSRRRAYSKCPWDHALCFRYGTLKAFPEPWMAVASILLYMRQGQFVEDKESHQRIPAPSPEDLAAVRGEMPPMLFDPNMVLDLA
jgi:hypothetical protein